MKQLFSIFILLLMVTALSAQDRSSVLNEKKSSVKDDNFVTNNRGNGNQYYPTVLVPYAPAGTVPFPINYNDYGSNGNNMRKIIVIGDTIIVGQDINPDMTGPPPATTPTRVYYQVSYDGGTTWMGTAVNASPGMADRWANISPIFNSGLRSILITGRLYDATQVGVVTVETMLGLGGLTNYIPPLVYRDYFGYLKNATTVGGVVSTPAGGATDSLVYMDYDFSANTWGAKKVIAPVMAANFRYTMITADNGQNIFAGWWNSNTSAMEMYESTNGGDSWGSPTVVGISGTISGGDTVASWFGIDVVYKPASTQHGLAFSTLAPGSLGTREGSKILYWSPTISGGSPVVIMDYHKYWFTNDTAQYNNNRNYTQVGLTNFSHPSLAYSDDGSVLYCAFSAVQKDTSGYLPWVKNYSFNDIFVCKSTDDGLTWGAAYYITNTATRDELYPSLSKSGNTASLLYVVYNESGSPGSFTFTDNAPIDTTYTVFKKIAVNTLLQVPVGIQNISTEVPANYSLSQNYPNPFNPTTTIRFAIPKTSSVTIKVYNVNGQLIETLVNNERVSVGTNEVKFNATNLSSGIYFYTIQAGDFKDTKKMMLIK